MKHFFIQLSVLSLACGESPSSPPIPAAVPNKTPTELTVPKSELTEQNPIAIDEAPTSPAPILNANALPPIGDGLIFHWTTQSFNGIAHQSLKIQEDGNAHHLQQETPASKPIEQTFQMKPHNLASLMTALKDNDLCGQESTVTQAIPDDGQTTFQLNFPELKCNVLLFNSETRNRPVKRSLNIIGAMIPKSSRH